MSLAGILNTARGALLTQQLAASIVSHNIANAETEGYSRQRVSLATVTQRNEIFGQTGAGVRADDVVRVRDAVLDGAVRREGGRAAGFGMRTRILEQVEGIFGEPSETGISASLDAFWGSWSDLAESPTSGSARLQVRDRGAHLVRSLNLASSRLSDLETNVRLELEATVETVNGLTGRIASLNGEIMAAEVGGKSANDLRDERDRHLDQLSKYGSVRVVEQTDGSVLVNMDGSPLVQGVAHQALRTRMVGGTPVVVRPSGQPVAFPSEGSALGEMVSFLGSGAPSVRASLDEMARGLVVAVNGIHETGWTPAGGTGVPLFAEPADPATITARNLSLSAAVLADSAVISASGVTGAPGDNSVALRLAALREDSTVLPTTSGTTSFADFYRGVVTGVAQDLSSAENSREAFTALAEQAETRRDGVSGVSIDEELVSLIQHQQAYTAATKLVTTVDEMLQALLSMV